MNVPEHSTLATKPVATFGTSRARATDSASAPIAAAATRVRISFRLVMASSGMGMPENCRKHWRERSPDSEIALVEYFQRTRRFRNRREFTDSLRVQAALALSRRYSVGVTPVPP